MPAEIRTQAVALMSAYAEGDLVAAAALMDLVEESGLDERVFWAELADFVEAGVQ